ncbi:MAG: hypothetical protein Q8K59_12765 [Nitrosomonas sp.]|nr:hypothetical protein [Nitrosomonas sp.]MDP1951935.1 hypothetical protein [Nitrosomonas sp.]
MFRQMIPICAAAFVLSTAFYTDVAAAHGNVSLEADNCVRGIEGSMVHLSTYQPQHDPEAEYCTEIPKEGNTFWVIDLVDHALRNMPIGIRVVKGNDEVQSETIKYIRSTYHPDGVIKGEFDLNEGLYTVFVTGEGVPPLHYEYPLRVQMFNYADTFRAAVVPLLVLLLLAFITNNFLKSRRLQR